MGSKVPGAEGSGPGCEHAVPDQPAARRLADQTLPRAHRVRRRGEFRRVQDRGQRFTSPTLILLLLPNPFGHPRLGVTVSSKVGNAVVRTRVKRWIREVFRRHRALLPPSVDAVLIARNAAPQAGYARLEADFRRLAGQASAPRGKR